MDHLPSPNIADRMSTVAEVASPRTGITREASFYALKELARRAGVAADFFNSWRIQIGDEYVNVYVQPGTEKHVRFKKAPANFWSELQARTFRTARACWMWPPQETLRTSVPDFVIPFSHEAWSEKRPLFKPVSSNCVECDLDLPCSTLFSLSRWEELSPGELDKHGRFKASMSLAYRDGFLHRPVVDEYGLALEQALTYLLPAWRPVKRELRVKLSHDIDEIGIPFSLRTAVGHTLRRRMPLATVRDMLCWLPNVNPTYLESVRTIVQLSLERGLDSAVYWKASPRGRMDSGYDPRHPRVQKMIRWLHERGVETGVHPGFETFLSPDRLRREIQILREALGDQLLGGRQDHLRWCPESWVHWEDCGLAYDSSVGYHDSIGFRAGTCIPYRPWLFSRNREARLIEIPLIVMEGTLLHSTHYVLEKAFEAVLDCVARCHTVGGVFTLLWHNNNLVQPVYNGLYERILDALVGHEKLQWRIPSGDIY